MWRLFLQASRSSARVAAASVAAGAGASVGAGICASSSSSSSRSSSSNAGVGAAATGSSLPERRIEFADRAKFEATKARMRADGAQRLQILTDFDYTLSRFWLNNKRGASCHKVLEDASMLSQEVHIELRALARYHYPIEVDPHIPQHLKTKYMVQWVTTAHELLASTHMSRDVIESAVATANIALRDGCDQFFDLVRAHKVPTLIFSAGIADVLEAVVRQKLSPQALEEPVHVISNRMIWDDQDCLVGFSEPLFHVFSKRVATVMHTPYFNSPDMTRRHNVLLLGDSTGDPHMSDGLSTDNIIRIGFLNDRPERLQHYLQIYDVVILGDGDMQFILDTLHDILGT